MKDIETKIKRPDVYKPLVLMLVLMFTQQFSGVATLTYYAVSIMENSGSSLDKYTATIIYGVIRLMGSSLGALMMRRSELNVSPKSRKLILEVKFLEVIFPTLDPNLLIRDY